MNMSDVAKKIYKSNGVKGFYPLIALSALGMFARGMAINEGTKLYQSLQDSYDEISERGIGPTLK
jgi:hypothetical protein